MPERYKAGGNLSGDGENARLGERAAAASGWVCVPVLQESLRGKNRNQYDYSNLATDAALSRIERETCNRKNESASRPLVYICSPYSHGCMNTNIENARKYSRFAVEAHCVPITPHLLFPQFLEDRQTAMSLNQVLLEKCSQLWVFGSVRSEGMQQEIQWAKQRQITIRYFTEELEEIE